MCIRDRDTTLTQMKLVVSIFIITAFLQGVLTLRSAYVHANRVSVDSWRCMHSQGFDHAVVRLFNGGQGLIFKSKENYINARTAGYYFVDATVFACNYCGGNEDTGLIAQRIQNYTRQHRMKFNTIWVSVRNCDHCWTEDGDKNLQYIKDLVSSLGGLGFDVGIKTEVNAWNEITGYSSSMTLSGLKLWYEHFDGVKQFNEPYYYHFGGWDRPFMKQIMGDAFDECGADIDISWRPNQAKYQVAGFNILTC
eukprot:TRINITY_DN3773_c0_g2_i1.p1 TRINITY_DN3773_c0_g2~~TRINITY_DN3773_c0_g2_i1.p1  ORF type:complete len:251 (+),score=38.21 TRINITY_DN3773_c0_g2_i1:66-818(+)